MTLLEAIKEARMRSRVYSSLTFYIYSEDNETWCVSSWINIPFTQRKNILFEVKKETSFKLYDDVDRWLMKKEGLTK